AVARGAPDAAAPPGPAGGARLRPRARAPRTGPAVRALLAAGHPVHRRRCGRLDLAGPAVPGRGLLAHADPAAVPAGLLGAADLHHPAAPASADDVDLPAGLLLRPHPHHRGGALGPDQPRRRRPRAGPARGDAPGRLGARRGADPRLRLSMIRSTLLRRSYPEAPVSHLYLMGRRHDFTYQQEVGGNTTNRHHVHFWRMPPDFVLPGGYRADWLAAGTYDRAVGFSFFTLQVTHRIDENIDAERDFVVDTLRYADPAIDAEVIRDFSTSYHHRNGQGDRIRTDGDLPVLDVAGAAERSDGATALMLPRHRPTGTSVMKSRARAALAAARRR